MGLRLGTRKEPKLRAHQSVTFAWPWERRCSVAAVSSRGPHAYRPARGGLRVLCAAAIGYVPECHSELACVCVVMKSARYLPCSADFVIQLHADDLVRARSGGATDSWVRTWTPRPQPGNQRCTGRFLFSTMYSTAEEEQQGEPPTPPAYRRPPAQRRWMYLNAHERAPASMKRRPVGQARTSR